MSETKKISGMITGAMSMFGSVANSVNRDSVNRNISTGNNTDSKDNSNSEVNPEDIPKEDLLQLCMKLNNRMQMLESAGQELSKKNKSLKSERRQLLKILMGVFTVPIGIIDEDNIDFNNLNSLYDKYLNDKQTELRYVDSKIKQSTNQDSECLDVNINNDKRSFSDNNDSTPDDAYNVSLDVTELLKKQRLLQLDIEKHISNETALRTLNNSLESALAEKAAKIEDMTKQIEYEHRNHEEKIIYLQMQLTAMKHKTENKEKELLATRMQLDESTAKLCSQQFTLEEKEDLLQKTNENIQSLQQRLSIVEPALVKAKDKLKDVERNAGVSTLLKAEQESLLASLRKDLKAANDARDESAAQLKVLLDQADRTDQLQHRLTEKQAMEHALRSELDERNALITRLRSEAATAEKNHALRTAMLATAEAQLETLTKQLDARTKTASDVDDRIRLLEMKLRDSELQYSRSIKLEEEKNNGITDNLKSELSKHQQLVDTLRIDHQVAIDNLQKEFTKKSTTARAMVVELEDEVQSLRQRVEELQGEIDSGSHAERRIFELAQKQASREATHGRHSDIREMAFQQMQATLASRDLALARLQHTHSQLVAEVADLRLVRKREGVNLDYLKNIVVQFMSFPATSPERLSLVPVIAMLLQFTVDELMSVENAMKTSLWSSRPIKELKPHSSPRSASKSGNNNDSSSGCSTSSHGTEQSLSPTMSSPRSRDAVEEVSDEMSAILRGEPGTPNSGRGRVPDKYYDPQAV